MSVQADVTSTSLTFHLVRAGLTKTLVATLHGTIKRDTLSHEAYVAVVHVAGWCHSGVATVATTARNFLNLSSGAFASCAFAPSLLIFAQHCYVA